MAFKTKKFTEQQVLEKLNISDFRHLSKDKIMTFFSMIPDMDPDVAKKAIEQFPSYASTVKEVASNYMEVLEKALYDNSESVQSYYDICKSILDTLLKMLERDDLSFDERKYVIDKILEVESRVNNKDTENKKHQIAIIGFATLTIITIIGGLATVLGGNSGISLPDLGKNE